ncbi:plestin 1 [Caulobacter phage Quill_5.2]|uniref:Plestin 1 n=1 Tax=Caulobacter phage Quill_5.2 TaxID=3075108 RepID=A0AA96Q2F8_9CAUD|nr:plestin 1 [Caulobacter phage Quill_5.2]
MGSSSKGAKAQANATLTAANMQAENDTKIAQMNKEASDNQAAAIKYAADQQVLAAQQQAAQIKEQSDAQVLAAQQQTQAIKDQAAQQASQFQLQIEYQSQMAEKQDKQYTEQMAFQKEQAAAAAAAAAQAAQAARDQAKGSQMQMEAQIAQKIAGDKAAEILAEKPQSVEVTLQSDNPDPSEVDPQTGRRRNPRAAFQYNYAGLQL